MRENVVMQKSFDFALRAVKLFKYLQSEKREYVISKQVLRSGTAVGALIHEASEAESRADFVHKMAIALKECNETLYWLKLLYGSDYISEPNYLSIYRDCEELKKLLVSIIKTTKRKKSEN